MATIKIQPGQTLTGIAQQQGTNVQDLLKVNPQITNPDLIFAGADLTLPSQTPATVNTPPSTLDINTVTAQPKPVEIPPIEEVDTSQQFVQSLRPPEVQAQQGFEETLPTFQDVFSQADAITEPVQEERQGLLTRIEESLGRLTGRGARQAELEQQAGVPENIQRLQQLNEQIAQTQGEFERQIAALPGQGRGITSGIVAGQQARARRQQAVEVGALSSVAQALQGNIALAQQTAQRTADLEFEPVEQEIANLRLLLDINQENMSTAEKRRAELLSVQLDERQRQIEEQKANKESIITFAAEAAQNGADNLTVNSILKAKTPEEALSIGSQFLAQPAEAETFTLSPGQSRFDAQGNLIATVPEYNVPTGADIVDINGVDYIRNQDGSFSLPNVPQNATEDQKTQIIDDKLTLIDSIIESEGLAGAVGAYPLARWTPFTADKADRVEFASSVMQLINQETIDTLVDLKERGGTLGALSDQERILLQSAATKIGSWIKKDGDGLPTGKFEVSEEAFLNEMNRIKDITLKAMARHRGLSVDQQEEVQYLKTNYGMSQQEAEQERGFSQPLSMGENGSVSRIAEAIATIESGGNYNARGPVVPSGRYKGERALGKYQIMPGNLPSWSKEALGRVVTPQEFMASPRLQDQIAQFHMNKLFDRYGNIKDVASVWHSGRPFDLNNAVDTATGLPTSSYALRAEQIFNELS